MNGYMDLFLETGNPAFYMMAKQGGASGAVYGATGAVYNAADRLDAQRAEEEASPR